MVYPLLPIDLRRKSKAQLKEIIEFCEAALLDGTYTSSHMATLIESEKEMSRREHIEVKRTIAEAQRTHYDLHPGDRPKKPKAQPLQWPTSKFEQVK